MSRITVRGARNSLTHRVKASLPCCQQVRSTLTRICCVRAPSQVRFPPHTLRAITMPRIARSDALLDRSARLPANLLQAQRDFFGAHTYERVDQPRGRFFHLDWPDPKRPQLAV